MCRSFSNCFIWYHYHRPILSSELIFIQEQQCETTGIFLLNIELYRLHIERYSYTIERRTNLSIIRARLNRHLCLKRNLAFVFPLVLFLSVIHTH